MGNVGERPAVQSSLRLAPASPETSGVTMIGSGNISQSKAPTSGTLLSSSR